MDLATLRDQFREMVSQTATNLKDATLNDLIERATQRIETDFADDYGPKPRQMLGRFSGTVTVDGVALPSDFQRARSVRIGNSNYRYMPLENMPTESAQQDGTAIVVYYRRIPKLANDSDTNWLLDISSRVYVYATAVEYAYWQKLTPQARSGYLEEYTNAARTLARANSPRPASGFGRSSDYIGGYYSIDADYMVFGGTQ